MSPLLPLNRLLASAMLQQSAQDEDGCFFVQRLIVVATLGALDAGGTARLAGALADGLQRRLPQLSQKLTGSSSVDDRHRAIGHVDVVISAGQKQSRPGTRAAAVLYQGRWA